ncbi:hypothetical protein [Acrocarpospora sp. B8E8]|uniref:hypothetical protein n=1 Tax=Acrocarpospora sp. B8E8 TaxID=3153572 RepID=UPI00325F5AE6
MREPIPPFGVPLDPQTGPFGLDLPFSIPIVAVEWVEFGVRVVGLLVALFVAWRLLRSGRRTARHAWRTYVAPRSAEDILTVVSASIATGVSAQGMWIFAGEVLGFPWPLQLLLFAFLEVAVITSAVRARRGMRENYSAGVDGMAVWALTSLSAVLSALHASSVPEFLFRLSAPLVAAWLWERGMAIERVRLTGKARIHWRWTPEKVMVRLGLAESSDRTASEVDAHRRLNRVALAADRVRELEDGTWRHRRATRALKRAGRKADEHTSLASNPVQRLELLDHIALLRGIEELPELEPPSVWGEHLRPRREIGAEAVAAVAELERFANRYGSGLAAHPAAPEADPIVSDVHSLSTSAAQRYARMLRAKQIPGLRVLKRDLGIGQDKATLVQERLRELAGQSSA